MKTAMINMKNTVTTIIILAIILAILAAGTIFSGCAGLGTTGLGSVVGAGIGALGDTGNRYRGAVNGALIGGAAGLLVDGTKFYMEDKAKKQAAMTGQPVTYYNSSGATVTSYSSPSATGQTNCRKVTTTTTVNGVSTSKTEEVCEGTRTTSTY